MERRAVDREDSVRQLLSQIVIKRDGISDIDAIEPRFFEFQGAGCSKRTGLICNLTFGGQKTCGFREAFGIEKLLKAVHPDFIQTERSAKGSPHGIIFRYRSAGSFQTQFLCGFTLHVHGEIERERPPSRVIEKRQIDVVEDCARLPLL